MTPFENVVDLFPLFAATYVIVAVVLSSVPVCIS